MRPLMSYNFGAIACNAAQRIYHALVLRPALYCRDVLSWKTKWALHDAVLNLRIALYVSLTVLFIACSIPLLIIEAVMSVVRPNTPDFRDPFNVP